MNKQIGKNIEANIDGNILTLKVDISKTFGPSKSGKTTIIASSEGNQKVGEVTIGLNVYTKA
jgi:ABC-type molybdate transport system ATPase subunit